MINIINYSSTQINYSEKVLKLFFRIILFYFLKKEKLFILNKGWLKFLTKIVIALGLMIICLFFLRGTIDQWVDYSFIQRAANLLLIISLSGAIYFVSLKFLGFEFNSFLRKSHHSS